MNIIPDPGGENSSITDNKRVIIMKYIKIPSKMTIKTLHFDVLYIN